MSGATFENVIDSLLAKHSVELASVCVMGGDGGFRQYTRGGVGVYDSNSVLQIASLSKTIGTAFTLELLRSKGIPLSARVNDVLDQYTNAKWRARVNPSLASEPSTSSWPDCLRLEHLASHSGGLGLHYVNGIPGGAEGIGRMPTPDELLCGKHAEDLGYPEIFISSEPGTQFAYSGAGFLVMQLIVEALHDGAPIHDIVRDFVAKTCGNLRAGGVAFDYPDPLRSPRGAVVRGKLEDGRVVHPFLRFPAFAAGGVGTSQGVCRFLRHLIDAYWSLDGSGPISHDTAVAMLHGVDRGSVKFIGAAMGLGVFVTWAGDNGIILHQAANDGFRGVYVACFRGPDVGKGFCVLNNGNDNGTRFNADLLQHLFIAEGWRHIDTSKFRSEAGGKDVPQEEIVNDVLRACVFEAFEPHLPEALEAASYELGGRDFRSFFAAADSDGNGSIDFREFLHLVRSEVGVTPGQVSNPDLRRVFVALDTDADGEISQEEFLAWFHGGEPLTGSGSAAVQGAEDASDQIRRVLTSVASAVAAGLPRHPVFGSGNNRFREAEVVECTDQGFARAGNLASPFVPRFDPTLFGRQGKVMDSWESGRHNQLEYDAAVFELAEPSPALASVIVSTEYHDGNHGEFVGVDVRDASIKGSGWFTLLPKRQLHGHSMHFFAVQCPLDRVTHVRVRNYPDGGITRLGLFTSRDNHTHGPEDHVHRCPSVIPLVQPLARVSTVWSPSRAVANSAEEARLVNVFSRGVGATIGGASNERFGPADACISDDPPAGMFDGCETARSRGADHSDWVIIHTAPTEGRAVEDMVALVVDFTFFRNNNPVDMSFLGWDDRRKQWRTLLPRFGVKAYAGNVISVPIPHGGGAEEQSSTVFTKFKVEQFPDGGFNRVRLLCKPKRSTARL